MTELEQRLKRAETALIGAGWTYEDGAQAWKPPVNHAVGRLWQRLFNAETEIMRLRYTNDKLQESLAEVTTLMIRKRVAERRQTNGS